MKDLLIAFFVLASVIGLESTMFFVYWCDKNHTSLTKVREENRLLREIVDSIDNPHHHDYLQRLESYRALQK